MTIGHSSLDMDRIKNISLILQFALFAADDQMAEGKGHETLADAIMEAGQMLGMSDLARSIVSESATRAPMGEKVNKINALHLLSLVATPYNIQLRNTAEDEEGDHDGDDGTDTGSSGTDGGMDGTGFEGPDFNPSAERLRRMKQRNPRLWQQWVARRLSRRRRPAPTPEPTETQQSAPPQPEPTRTPPGQAAARLKSLQKPGAEFSAGGDD
jgi:hypothetical protein